MNIIVLSTGRVWQFLLEIVGVIIDTTILKINLTMYPEIYIYIYIYKNLFHLQVKAVISFPERYSRQT